MSRLTVRATAHAMEGPFDRQRLITGWNQARLRDARVMVVGAGAIGNEVLKNLALLGVGYLFVVDLDKIATSNLSRTVLFRPADVDQPKAEVAARRTRELCLEPTAEVDWFHGDLVWELGTGVFRRMDVVLGCVDNVEARLAINRHCRLAGTPWIDAGMYELGCRVSVFPVGSEVCFECGVSAREMASSRERRSCDVFRRRELAAGRVPTTQVTGALVAALQVQQAVKLLCGQPIEPGESIDFHGTVNACQRFRLNPREGCLAHADAVVPTPLDLSLDTTLRVFLKRVSRDDAAGPGCVLDRSGEDPFVVRARCRNCRRRWVDLMAPSFRVFEDELRCAECRQAPAAFPDDDTRELPLPPEVVGSYTAETPAAILDLSLRQIGVPLLGLLCVRDANGVEHWFEPAGDVRRLFSHLPDPNERSEA